MVVGEPIILDVSFDTIDNMLEFLVSKLEIVAMHILPDDITDTQRLHNEAFPVVEAMHILPTMETSIYTLDGSGFRIEECQSVLLAHLDLLELEPYPA